MVPLLQKLFAKRGIKDLTELHEDEKKDFDRWEKILSEGDMTVDKIVDFCNSQIIMIEAQMRNLDNIPLKNERLILLHSVYKTLMTLIKSPETEKANLEKYLNTLL